MGFVFLALGIGVCLLPEKSFSDILMLDMLRGAILMIVFLGIAVLVFHHEAQAARRREEALRNPPPTRRPGLVLLVGVTMLTLGLASCGPDSFKCRTQAGNIVELRDYQEDIMYEPGDKVIAQRIGHVYQVARRPVTDLHHNILYRYPVDTLTILAYN